MHWDLSSRKAVALEVHCFSSGPGKKVHFEKSMTGGTLTYYHDLLFQSDMLMAKRKDGTTIRLSRQEHALLLRLKRNPHTLVTRAELLEALGGKTGSLSVRNIDYLINRLRKRLGDTARESRFIATRYGDGYVWVADPVRSKPLSAFLLIGPVYGWSDDQDAASDIPDRLADSVKSAIGGQQSVLWRPHWRPEPQGSDNLDFTLDVSIHMEADLVHLALVLREGRSQRIIENFRRSCARYDNQGCIDNLAQGLADALWHHATLREAAETAVMRADEMASLREAVARRHRASRSDNCGPRISVMLALNIYEKMIQSIDNIHHAPLSDDEWQSMEAEIENLVLRALPDAHDDPQLLLAIAKLLRFIDRGYLDLAGRLTHEAFCSSTTFAEAFSMKGQIAASRGGIDAAIAFYDKSIEMVEPASRFHIHLLILKIFSLMAEESRAAAYHAVLDLHNIAPLNQTVFGLLFIPPNARQLCSDTESMLAGLTPAAGRSLCSYLFRAWARQFQHHEHRQNVLSGLAFHLQRHHGNAVLGPDITERFPKLVFKGE